MKGLKQIAVALVLLAGGILGACAGGEGGGETPGDAIISIDAIPGVTVPVRGAEPDAAAIETAQYTGAITWSPADTPFKDATVYTAKITVTAKAGYTVDGVAENFFTVAGAVATNAANSGVVTAVFPQTGAASDVDVNLISAVQAGGASGTADSTGLILTFDADPAALTADNITVTGATKGALSGSGTTRTLEISDITVQNGETVAVTVTSPAGYAISGSPKSAVVYRALTALTFLAVNQSGGISQQADSTALILFFDVDPVTLTADDITVTGATKGALTDGSSLRATRGSRGFTRVLAISDITVGNGETVSVSITSPAGYSLSGSPQTALVYRAPYIGMPYQGGVIAYILQSGDPGYVSGETHGFIAATADLSTGIQWYNGVYMRSGGGGKALGTGQANTAAIVAALGTGSYAAKLCDEYTNADTGTGVYSDWFLPSQDELNVLYLNRASIGGFTDGYYWSSSEYDGDNAWFHFFADGEQASGDKFYLNARVRAVRAF